MKRFTDIRVVAAMLPRALCMLAGQAQSASRQDIYGVLNRLEGI